MPGPGGASLSDYRIFETEQFQSDLRTNLGPYPQLRAQPFFGRNIKKLKGHKPETWRYRIGGFRFFYEIDESRKIVFMIAVDTRQKSY
jgi:mRNA interferase RelE/StbE